MKKRGTIFLAAALTAFLIGGCAAGAKEESPNIIPDPVMPAGRDPEAKAAAKHITDTNNNDGVAKAIQKYVFGL